MSGNNYSRLSKCSVGEDERAALMRVLANEYFGMGKEVEMFENELKAFLQTDLEVICVNTGTAALHLALLCLDLKAGDEVLVPSLTYVASYQAISAVGAIPISCDVDADTGFIDLQDAEKRISQKTKVIMPVHYASNCAQIPDVYTFAQKHKLRVVEDAAHSIGSLRGGQRVGKSGDVLCFSFDGIKNITSGEGGALVTGDQVLAQRVKDARLLGVEKDTEKRFAGARSWVFDVKHQGFRYHMSDIMAALGRAQLKRISEFSTNRQKIASLYKQDLTQVPGVQLLDIAYDEIVPHIFAIKVAPNLRDPLRAFLESRKVASGVHYYPNHFLTMYKSDYALPGVESLYERLLTLPLHNDVQATDVRYVTDSIKEFMSRNS